MNPRIAAKIEIEGGSAFSMLYLSREECRETFSTVLISKEDVEIEVI